MQQYLSASVFLCATLIAATCGVPAEAAQRRSNSAAPAARCTASATTPWVIPARAGQVAARLRVEAFADGPTCDKVVAVYVIRALDGTVLHQESYIGENNAVTKEVKTMSQMRAALARWTSYRNSDSFYDRLPNWAENARAPEMREFGFIPDESLSRADYQAIKTARPPSICYVAGIESLVCLVYRGGRLETFGIQPFPG